MDDHEKSPITQIDVSVKTQWRSWPASCLTKDLKRTDEHTKHKCNYTGLFLNLFYFFFILMVLFSFTATTVGIIRVIGYLMPISLYGAIKYK